MKAILISNENDYRAELVELDEAALPEGDVLVDVKFSTLNYKDALAITGQSPVVRRFPMIPGIDLAGQVQASSHPDFAAGDMVLANGFGLGENHCGGLAQKARLKGDWLLPLPEKLSAREAMAIGTAGYTAMLCIMALEDHGIGPASGDILVSGATGGVGSIAISLLARAGYAVTASTGRAAKEADYLKSLGATNIIERAQLSEPGRPLQKERWAAAIDVAGGHTLANICASTAYGGVVAACGLAEHMDFPASVLPFILRGITLCGIDSVHAGMERRRSAWERLARDMDRKKLTKMSRSIGLAESLNAANELLQGKIRGRLVVDMSPQVINS